jgi:hypothetical protein
VRLTARWHVNPTFCETTITQPKFYDFTVRIASGLLMTRNRSHRAYRQLCCATDC